jgi:hypothetical protein
VPVSWQWCWQKIITTLSSSTSIPRAGDRLRDQKKVELCFCFSYTSRLRAYHFRDFDIVRYWMDLA